MSFSLSSASEISSLRSLRSIEAGENRDVPRHRWYVLKESFSHEIVRKAIDDQSISKDEYIIDPFAGSGTVSLTASQLGYNVIGFEVNPFLAFVARTKLLNTLNNSLEEHVEAIEGGIVEGLPSPLQGFSTFTEGNSRKKWLFNKAVIESFEGGWQTAASCAPEIRDLLSLALLGAAMDTCNARKDGKCLRYKSDWRESDYGKVDYLEAFRERIATIKMDSSSLPLLPTARNFFQADSRQIDVSTIDVPVKLCVTSPPYLNSLDYTDVYRPELFLGKFVTSMEELRALRQQTLRSHIQAKWKEPQMNSFGPRYARAKEEIQKRSDQLWDKRLLLMIQAYFEDMWHVLKNIAAIMSAGGSMWIVVSTSSYAGVEVPVDLILSDIAHSIGWNVREVCKIRNLKRVSGQQWESLTQGENEPWLRESVIVLDR